MTSADPNIETISPFQIDNWDQLVTATRGHSIFHSAGWAKVLCEAYGYTPRYFVHIKNSRMALLIPMMEINSPLTGKRAVCLPFSDFCFPLCDQTISARGISKKLLRYGRTARLKSIEIRGGIDFGSDSASEKYYCHTLDLSPGLDLLYSQLHHKTRKYITKARASDIDISFSRSFHALDDFCSLNSTTRKSHGLPPQPARFFRAVWQHIISPGFGIVARALYRGEPVSSIVCLHYGDNAILKYLAWDRTYHLQRPNDLLIWEIIKWCHDSGYNRISFGRSDPADEGLLHFKRRWTTDETLTNYYRYDIRKKTFSETERNVSPWKRTLLRRTPKFILKAIGTFLYRHHG